MGFPKLKLPTFSWNKKTHSAQPRLFDSQRSSSQYKNQITNSTYGGGAKVRGGISGDGRELYFNSVQLTRNSRIAYHDSIQARGIVNRDVDLIVDTGIKVSPTCNASILGITDEKADIWNDDVAERFHLFMKSKKCHRSRRMNGYEAQRLFQKAMVTDGDMFVRYFFEEEDDALSTLSFEFIDTLHICGEGITGTGGYANQFDGITRDSKGRETSYRIKIFKSDGSVIFKDIPATRSNRVIISHSFDADQISQLRGMPQYAHALQEFQRLTDFTDAHISKAITQASIAIAIENDGEEDPSNPFEDMMDPAGFTASDEIGYSSLSPEQQSEVDSIHINNVQNFSNSSDGSLAIVNLKAKDKVKTISNTAPVTNYDKFVDSFTSHLTASVGQPMEVYLMKFGSNYSASRAALILFYRIAEIRRAKIDSGFITPTYENWLAEEIAYGRIECLGWSDPVLRGAWVSHSLIGAPVPNIDPLKTAKANKENADIGATDFDRAAQETNGSSGKANRSALKRQWKELAEVNRIKEEAGIEGS